MVRRCCAGPRRGRPPSKEREGLWRRAVCSLLVGRESSTSAGERSTAPTGSRPPLSQLSVPVKQKVLSSLGKLLAAAFLELEIFGPFEESATSLLVFRRGAEASQAQKSSSTSLLHDPFHPFPLPSRKYHICGSFCKITTPPQQDSAQNALDSILCEGFSHVFRMGDETCNQNLT